MATNSLSDSILTQSDLAVNILELIKVSPTIYNHYNHLKTKYCLSKNINLTIIAVE